VLYGYLSPRVTFGRLLRTAIGVNIFPGFLFLLIGGPGQAILVAAAVGLIVGFANVALFDLLLRSCPRNLEGSVGMLGHSALGLAGAAADLLGAWLYEQGGFALCIVIDAVATMLILPLLKRLPSSISAGRDGVPAAVLGETAAVTLAEPVEAHASTARPEV
jgi:MFS family permease